MKYELEKVFFVGLYLGKNDKAASKYPGDHPFSRVIVGSRENLLIYASLRLFFSKEQMSTTDAKTIFIVKGGSHFRGQKIHWGHISYNNFQVGTMYVST